MKIELFKNGTKPSKRADLLRLHSIFRMKECGKGNREIARSCKCSASTVSVVLNKYKHPNPFVWDRMSAAEKAERVYRQQKANIKSKKKKTEKILLDKEIRKYIHKKLIIEGWSPEMIAGRIKRETGKEISKQSIYRYIKKHRRNLVKYLHEQGKPRKQRVSCRRSTLKKKPTEKKRYIEERAEQVEKRQEFGHWEGDLVVGPKGGSGRVVLSLVERKTRKKKFIKMPNREADTTLAHLRAFIMNAYPGSVKSITFDNGGEFSVFSMHKLKKPFPELEIFYTEPYAPQQKGSNEHANGRLRKKFPKGTDFVNVSKEALAFETQKLNNKPMKLHDFRTPEEMFEEEIELLKNESFLTASLNPQKSAFLLP